MISRVADSCFWFGRYLDRAESTTRLLHATRTLAFDADIPVTQCWQPLVIVSGEYPRFAERHGTPAAGDGETVQRYMVWDGDNGVSLLNSVRAARECARGIRDTLSLETWEEVNGLYLWLGEAAARRAYDENREEFYRNVRRGTQLCLGLIRSTMLHDAPMSFLWLGVMLERVGQIARILDMHHHTMERESASTGEGKSIVEVALWLSLLKACSGSEAFMKKHQGRVTAASVVSFLVFEAQFPRSLRYCLRASLRLLRDVFPERERGSIARLAELCAWMDREESELPRQSIHGLLTHVVDETAAVCSLVAADILGPVRPRSEPGQSQAQ